MIKIKFQIFTLKSYCCMYKMRFRVLLGVFSETFCLPQRSYWKAAEKRLYQIQKINILCWHTYSSRRVNGEGIGFKLFKSI